MDSSLFILHSSLKRFFILHSSLKRFFFLKEIAVITITPDADRLW
jgi:hypothetical protein